MQVTEKIRLWIVAFIVIAVVYIVAYAEVSAASRFGISAVGLAIAVGLVVFSQTGKTFSRFIRDTGVELRKVVWPTRQETLQLTGVVFAFLIAATIFLWLADFFIGLLVDALTGQ